MGLLDQSQPGAITQMLGLLMQHPAAGQPGQPPPQPVAPTPRPNPPAVQMQPQQNLLGKIHDYIQERLGGNVPSEYQSSGLLSPDEIQSAKPGILQEIAHSDSYRKNLDRMVEMHQMAAAVGEHQRILQSRQSMPEGLDLPGMLKYAAQHGDVEMIKTLGDPLSRMLGENPATASERTPRTFSVNGQPVEGFSDKAGKFYTADGNPIPVGAKVTPYVAPKEQSANFTAVPGVDPDTGKPTVFMLNTRTGKMESTGVGKPTAGAAGQNAPQMAAAKANMESAMKVMDDYEAKLKKNPALYGVMDATQGAMASSPSALNATGPMGALHSLTANMALSHIQKTNPELYRYMTAKKLIAEAILNTHKRPNQTQYEIEQELSGVGPNPNPMQIDIGAQRRQRMYQDVFANPEAGAVGGPAKSSGTLSYEDWKKSKGHK